ncbi:hypothetical protein BURKHO8Y_40049 [Burkholderia sp. 8Y]|nr:hypothetical protein BURKHO8Y_40049 [Burkholderia sp. 8Y]
MSPRRACWAARYERRVRAPAQKSGALFDVAGKTRQPCRRDSKPPRVTLMLKERTMPLDPEVALILGALESAPRMECMSVAALRASLVYPPLERRTAVGEVIDLQVPLKGRVLGARLYRPQERPSDGVTLFFHGGGFVIGNLDTHNHVCRDLCEGSGAALIALDYRLAPEHSFPAAVDDCDALRWVAQHAKALPIDAARMVCASLAQRRRTGHAVALRRDDSWIIPHGPGVCKSKGRTPALSAMGSLDDERVSERPTMTRGLHETRRRRRLPGSGPDGRADGRTLARTGLSGCMFVTRRRPGSRRSSSATRSCTIRRVPWPTPHPSCSRACPARRCLSQWVSGPMASRTVLPSVCTWKRRPSVRT